MICEPIYEAVYGENIRKEKDGTFTIDLKPWFDKPIRGIPTHELALDFVYAAHMAMRDYADSAMCEY